MSEPTFAQQIASLQGMIGQVIDSALSWATSFLETIADTPLLFIFVVAVPLIGLGVGLLNRVIRSN